MLNNEHIDDLAESAITSLSNHIQIYLSKPLDSNSYVSDNELFAIVKNYIKKEITS